MRTRLFVRLHRDAVLPGARCEWILRGSRGEEINRGIAPVDAMPRASELIGIIAHDLLVIRSVPLPPGRRARTSAALASAIEPFLLSDPASNYVAHLGDAGAGMSVLAAASRAWVDSCLQKFADARLSMSRLIGETSLLEQQDRVWVAVCIADGGFLRLDGELATGLDHTIDGQVPESIKARARQGSGQVQRLRIYHAQEHVVARWQDELQVPVEYAGRWDWAAATAGRRGASLRAAPDLLSAFRRGAESSRKLLRHWRTPAAIAACALLVHVLATIAQWSIGAAERAKLRSDIHASFREVVPAAEPLVDPVLQTRRALGSVRRGAGLYASNDLISMLGRFAAASGALPPGSLQAIRFSAGTLDAELSAVPAAQLERLVDRLRSDGLHVETRASAAQVQLTMRAEP